MHNIPQSVQICAVTKSYTLKETKDILQRYPKIKIIAENRWPDCEEKFKHFDKLQRHFIGPLQSNKVTKVLPLVDVVQSVTSTKLMDKMNEVAAGLNKVLGFCIQVNIADDDAKHGIHPSELDNFIKYYLQKQYKNLELIGLMTIGSQDTPEKRAKYFAKFKQLFDRINQQYFSQKPLKTLSMGMSDDYQLAIKEGATMIRLGHALAFFS